MLEINHQILFFLSALGAFNGLLLAGYLAFTKRNQISFWFLSALLLMISVRVGKSVMFYFYPELDRNILQLGLSACFLIGPMAYFYTLTTTRNLSTLQRSHFFHVLALLSATFIFGLTFPYKTNVELWGTYVYKIVNYTWLVYAGLAWLQIHKSFHGQKPLLRRENLLLLGVNIGVSIIWVAYFTASYTSYIVGAVSFSLILYVAIITLFVSKPKRPIVTEPYQSKKFDDKTVSELSQKLNQTMLQDDYYCSPLLSMPQTAKKMGVSSAQVSQLLNDNFNKSFTTFVNELRIEKAKSLLISEQNMTVEVIAEHCGYNSLSTFYGAFKKIVDMTPVKYRESYK